MKNTTKTTLSTPSTSIVGTVCTVLFIGLLVGKLTGLLTLSWLGVFVPVLVELAYITFVLAAYVVVALATARR